MLRAAMPIQAPIRVPIRSSSWLAAAALGASCGGAPPPPLANHTDAPATGVRAIDWRNRSYALEGIGAVAVVDGRADFALDDDGKLVAGEPGGPQTSAALRIDRPLFADVDGDGVEDAIVLCVLGTGGTGQFSAIRIFTVRGAAVAEIAEIPGGDRGDGGIRSVALDGRTVIVERNVLAEGDGACCASTRRRERWTWRDGAPAEDVAARGPLLPVSP